MKKLDDQREATFARLREAGRALLEKEHQVARDAYVANLRDGLEAEREADWRKAVAGERTLRDVEKIRRRQVRRARGEDFDNLLEQRAGENRVQLRDKIDSMVAGRKVELNQALKEQRAKLVDAVRSLQRMRLQRSKKALLAKQRRRIVSSIDSGYDRYCHTKTGLHLRYMDDRMGVMADIFCHEVPHSLAACELEMLQLDRTEFFKFPRHKNLKELLYGWTREYQTTDCLW